MNDGLAEKKKMVFLGLLFYSSPQLVILGIEYDNTFSDSVNLSVYDWFSLASFIGYFRVAPSLYFKARLSTKPLIWKPLTRMVLQLL